MGYYKVNYGSYSICHNDNCKYFDYFDFDKKKYPIGAYVTLTDYGMSELFYSHGYNYIKGNYRLVDHYITESGREEWTYIIGHLYNSTIPVLHSTKIRPEKLVSEVLYQEINEVDYTPGELKVTFAEPNYSPQDWEVKGVLVGWLIAILICIAAFVFKDWFITLLIQIVVGFYFGNWREKKINEAISTQKFKE